MPYKKNASATFQGLTRLVTDATVGITNLVEAMHRRIVHPPFLPSTPIQHLITDISGVAYNNIRWSAQLIGKGTDKVLDQLGSVLGDIEATDKREAMQSILNGVVGDYLEKTANPLSIDMQFRSESKVLPMSAKGIKQAYSNVNGKLLVMVHGSCMNDRQWTQKDHNHGISLAKDLEMTPVYLYYNTGRHISSNGRLLSELLDELIAHWPVPIEELVILGHSMGGLVTRSALYYGQQQESSWPDHLKKIIFIGTPHHGAPLERIGNYLDVILEAIPYAKPFARLGKIRSAGVTDLRYGNLVDEDWNDTDRFKLQKDSRQHIPLTKHVICYSIAGVAGKTADTISSQLLGDNMVGVKSALGQHKDPSKDLNFRQENTLIVYETNHIDLLSSMEVYDKMLEWLG